MTFDVDGRWAVATAGRLSDESDADEDDKKILYEVLLSCFIKCPNELRKLVGTSIIEEDYFDELD